MKKHLSRSALIVFLAVSPLFSKDLPCLTLGDQYWSERATAGKAQSSLDQYADCLNTGYVSVEMLWKASRAAWWAGDELSDNKARMDLFDRGMKYGEAAVVADPNSAEAHFWLGGNQGSYGETRGVMKSLGMVKPIRKEMNEVIRINPDFEQGAAYRVLGVVDYKVPGIAGGSKKRAQEQLEKALALGPANPLNVFYMGEYYLTVGEKQRAKEILGMLATLPVEEDLKPELARMQLKAAPLLEKLK